jgi:hypothetical protein
MVEREAFVLSRPDLPRGIAERAWNVTELCRVNQVVRHRSLRLGSCGCCGRKPETYRGRSGRAQPKPGVLGGYEYEPDHFFVMRFDNLMGAFGGPTGGDCGACTECMTQVDAAARDLMRGVPCECPGSLRHADDQRWGLATLYRCGNCSAEAWIHPLGIEGPASHMGVYGDVACKAGTEDQFGHCGEAITPTMRRKHYMKRVGDDERRTKLIHVRSAA